MIIVVVLVLLGGMLAVLGRVVLRDGHGWRPPPASRPEQERIGSWPR